MMRLIVIWSLSASLLVLGCNSPLPGLGNDDGGTDDGGTVDGGDGGEPSTVISDSQAAVRAWAEASCPCLAEEYTSLTENLCNAGYDFFFPVSNAFLFRHLTEEQDACLEQAIAESEGQAALECRTTAANNAATCFANADLDCTNDGEEPVFDPDFLDCLTAIEAEREACPDMPESWDDDLTACTTATPAETAAVFADVSETQCECPPCLLDDDVTPEERSCVIDFWNEAIADEEAGAENQMHLDCMNDVSVRAQLCFADVTECGEAHTECAFVFLGGLDGLCGEDAIGLLIATGEACFDEP